MANSLRIDCVNKSDRTNAWERIRNVGGPYPNEGRWELTVAAAVEAIENGTLSFYVERPIGNRVDVIVAKSAAGHKYLKTRPDGDQPNNLLSLPECR